MSKHTKGPLARSKHGTPDYAPQFGVYAEEGDGRDIAIVRGDNADADSLLFAAAPELLTACQMFADAIRDRYTNGEVILLVPGMVMFNPFMAAKSAIAKATQV